MNTIPGIKSSGSLLFDHLQGVVEQIHKYAPTDMTVILTGESGTGKTEIANLIHSLSSRARNPLRQLNCSSLAAGLAESELFGHEKGAFTGAGTTKLGIFESAPGGTVFLDEIGDLALEQQPKLLHALENKIIRRVGGVQAINIDVRIIAATHKNLFQMVKEHRFREDLYYRLSQCIIELPSLRQCPQRIPGLTYEMLNQICGQNKKSAANNRISSAAMQLLMQYAWPGNIRELRNCISRAAVDADFQTIEREHVAAAIESQPARPASASPSRRDPSRLGFLRLLFRHGGHLQRVAEALGISEDTARRLQERLQIPPGTGRPRAQPDAPRHDAPFVAGPAIKDPRHFVGRRRVVHQLCELWRQQPLQHAVLQGARRSGKTSLAWYLRTMLSDPKQRPDWLAKQLAKTPVFTVVYVDFKDPASQQLYTLLPNLLEQMNIPPPEPCSLIEFGHHVRSHLQKPTLVILDEVSALQHSHTDLDVRFWNTLRALVNATQYIAYFATTSVPFAQCMNEVTLTSPFWNVFSEYIELGPMNDEETDALINQSPYPYKFPISDIDWIKNNIEHWPSHLQTACRIRLYWLKESPDSEEWKEAILRSLSSC